MEDSQIFSGPDPVLLKRYKKAITLGRIVVFLYAIFCLGLTSLALVISVSDGVDNDALIIIWGFGILGTLFLAAGLLSNRKPFAWLLTTTILSGLVWVFLCLGFFAFDKTYDSLQAWSITLVVLATVLVVLRSTVFARKYRELVRGSLMFPGG